MISVDQDLRHKELTYRLRKVVFGVREELKTGWSEEIYHQVLVHSLNAEDIPTQSKPRKVVSHREQVVHEFEADIIVWDKIILELKVIPHGTFSSAHFSQIIHYLKRWGLDLGMLVNFGPTRAEIKRVVWDDHEPTVTENYSCLKGLITNEDRNSMIQVRQGILDIVELHGLGYSETIYRSMLDLELQYLGLNFDVGMRVPARRAESVIAEHQTDYMMIEGSYLIAVRALLERPSRYDFAQMKTFLHGLSLRFGLIVNFGKNELQIYGVRAD